MANFFVINSKLYKHWAIDLIACVPLLCLMIAFLVWRASVTQLTVSPWICFTICTTDKNNENQYAIQEIQLQDPDDPNTFEDIEGGTAAFEIFEEIERQTRPLAVIQDKILKSKTTLNEDNACSICLELLKKGNLQLQISCLHMFHFKCIKEWAAKENSCPECRAPINVQF